MKSKNIRFGLKLTCDGALRVPLKEILYTATTSIKENTKKLPNITNPK